jgi:hypothetical protein
MTAPEHLNDRTAAIQRSRRRAPARNAEVHSNSDIDRDDTRPKMQNRPAFATRIGVRATRTFAPHSCKVHFGQLAGIENP